MSPALISFEGFTLALFTWTRPPSTAFVAALRVLKNRAAHSHLSILTGSMPSFQDTGSRDNSSAVAGLRTDTPLEGRIVRVEPIAERHREGLRAAAELEPQIHRYTGMYSLGFERWFDEALGSETEVPFAVLVDGRPVGSTRYLNIEPFHRRTEIGWTWLERIHWGTGANIETKYLLLRNAFENWGAMRVEFKTDARNLRVRGALLGIGATFEGIFRKHMVLPDSIRDSAWYAIVDDDWPAAKALLEKKIEQHAA